MLSSVEEMGLSRPPGGDVDYMQMVKSLVAIPHYFFDLFIY